MLPSGSMSKTFEQIYNAKSMSHGFLEFIAKSELQPIGMSNSETHYISASIILTDIRRFLNVQSIDFLEENEPSSDDNMSDVIFIFKDEEDSEKTRKLHANKTYLSLHSPVFKTMFFSNFEEQNKEQIVLDDNFDEFHELLQVIYPTRKPITEKNVESLIRLGDKYDITHIQIECELFLIFSDKVGVAQKLIISDDLSLPELKANALRGLVRIEQLTSLRKSDDYKKLSEAVKLELLEKMFEILK